MRVPVEVSHSARLRAAVSLYGERAFARRAADLLRSGVEEPEFLLFLGGRAAGLGAPWPQVWGARALEYYWVESAASAVVDGLDHDHWRVRMQCARLCAVRELGVPELLASLLHDDNWRVRDAAAWALGRVGEFEQAHDLQAALLDPHEKVRDRAALALAALAERLDRDLG